MVILLDVDGTMVDYENRPADSVVQAIRKARTNGHKVYLSTGRSMAEIYPELLEIGFDGMICGGGCYVESNGRVILHQCLSFEQCRHFVNWFNQEEIGFIEESNNGLFANDRYIQQSRSVFALYAGTGKDVSEVSEEDIFDLFRSLRLENNLVRDDVNKVSFVLRNQDDLQKARDEFKDLDVDCWGGKGEEPLFGVLSAIGVDKRLGIEVLLKELGKTKADVLSIGDAKQDIPMFEMSGIAIAMGNGGQQCKQAADYITDDVEHDGLYKAFVHFKLIDDFLHLADE